MCLFSNKVNAFLKQEIPLKTIYDEVAKDIFDMSNMIIFKEIEKKKRRDVYTLLCLPSAELSKAFDVRKPMIFQNICGDASRVQDGWNLAKTRVRTKQIPCAQMLHI